MGGAHGMPARRGGVLAADQPPRSALLLGAELPELLRALPHLLGGALCAPLTRERLEPLPCPGRVPVHVL